VIVQEPAAGTQAYQTSTVTITVSRTEPEESPSSE
jgi:beta-lactam-binding protein with PASTA domain